MSQFCLRWNNHQPNFISVFTTLLNTESLVDVTLAAEGKHLQAHKVVLSACSVYFQTLFTTNPSRHPIVIIKDVSYSDLRVLVDFMYYGEVNVTEEQLPRILDTARLLKIKGLTEMPDSTKHSSPGACAQPASPERRAADADAGAQWHGAASPGGKSPAAKRKRHKQSEDSGPPLVEAEKPACAEPTPAETDALPVGLFRQDGGLYTNINMQRGQELEETRPQQMQLQHAEPALGFQHDPVDGSARLVAPIPGMQWGNAGYAAPAEQLALRQDGGGGGGGGGGNYMAQQRLPTPTDANLDPYAAAVNSRVINETPTQRITDGKRRRTVNPQAAENFQRAIEAVRFGGIGFCKAARIFGVNNRTLWLEYKKKGYPIHRPSIRERIKREPTEPDPPPRVEPADLEPQLQQAPPGYIVNHNCFQYLQDSSLQGF